MELLEAMESLRETWLFQYLNAIPTPIEVLAILNPFKSMQYFRDYIILLEALRDYKNQGPLSGRVGLKQLCQYRMLVFFATMAAIHHIVLLNLYHPSHWFRMVIADYVGLFQMPGVFPLHVPLSVLLYLETLNFFFWKIARFSNYELIRDLLSSQESEHPFMLNSLKLVKLRNNTIKMVRIVQFFGNFCDIQLLLFIFLLVVTYLSEYSLVEIINCLGLASMLIMLIIFCIYWKSFVILYSSILPLAYFFTFLIDARLIQNNKLLWFVPKRVKLLTKQAGSERTAPMEDVGVPERSLVRFRINHIESIRFFLIICPDFSALWLHNIAIVYSFNTSLMASFLRQPRLSIENVLILSAVITFMGSNGAFHLMVANQSKRLHSPFHRFLPASSIHCFHRRGDSSKRIRTSLRLAMFGQEFHTKRRYGLQYGPLGLVNMAAFGKSIFLFIKLFFICFRKG